MWVTENAEPYIDVLGLDGTIENEFDVSLLTGGIITGPDQNVWFTDFDGDRIGKITPAGDVTLFQLNNQCAHGIGLVGPLNIIVGSDGALWITDVYADGITRMTTAGQFSTVCMPSNPSGPFDLAAGPDGNIWFTYPGDNAVGMISLGLRTEAKTATSNTFKHIETPHFSHFDPRTRLGPTLR
jgi:virginiamycin B lyase